MFRYIETFYNRQSRHPASACSAATRTNTDTGRTTRPRSQPRKPCQRKRDNLKFVVKYADYRDWDPCAHAMAEHIRYRNRPERRAERIARRQTQLNLAA